jgi:hypothetical protein
VPGYFFNLLLLSIVGMSLAADRKARLTARSSSWVFAILFGFALLTAFILHRFHPLADFLAVVPVTIAYAFFLRSSGLTPAELLSQLKWLYSFHVAFIVFELLLFSLDARSVLETLSGGRYRELSFHLLSKLILNIGNGMPNSLLLQAQAASHLVGSAYVLFYLASDAARSRGNVAILAALFVLFLLVMTNMSMLVFFIAAVAVWVIRASVRTKFSALLVIVAFMAIFSDRILPVVLYRFYDGSTLDPYLLDYYLWYFTVPITNLADARPLELLFGHGMDTDMLESGEIGVVTMAFIGGVYVIGLMFAWFAGIAIAGFRSYRKFRNARDPQTAAWTSLLFVNLVLCAAWALSTGHYMIAIIPGGMHLFAFGLAIVIVAHNRLRKSQPARPRKVAYATPLPQPYGELSGPG